MIRKTILFLVFSLLHREGITQVNVKNYFSNNVFDQESATSFLRLDFKWDMPSAVQVEMNEGLNAIEEQTIE